MIMEKINKFLLAVLLLGIAIPTVVASHECVLIGESTILGPWYRTECPEFIPKSVIEKPVTEKMFIEKRVIEDNEYTMCSGAFSKIQVLGVALNNTVCLKDPNTKDMKAFARIICELREFKGGNYTSNNFTSSC